RPAVEVAASSGADDERVEVVLGEQAGQGGGQVAAGRVGVVDNGDVEAEVGGVVGDAGRDGRVRGLRAEQGDGAVAGLGGEGGVGEAFADQQHVAPGTVRGRKGEAGVRGEGGSRVVVLAARVVGVEVAGLDIGDVPAWAQSGQDGGHTRPV